MGPSNTQAELHSLNGNLSIPDELKPAIVPFAGRLGGNQNIVLNPHDHRNEAILHKTPDASPIFRLRNIFILAGFSDVQLWKFAMIECIGTMLIVFNTAWVAIHPASATATSPLGSSGVYGTPTFLAPLVGGFVNWFSLMLFIYSFANVSGSHINPTITFATFFARIVSFPRLVLYVAAQALGGTLAGFILRRAYGTRDFSVGGCTINTDLVPVGDAFVLEFIYTTMLLFLSFGVGLDPRQGSIIGATLSPCLVGLVLGLLSWASAFTRPGYSGASMNPARCFGAFVGSSFPSYHWIHWVAPISASIGHGIVYAVVPPWQSSKSNH